MLWRFILCDLTVGPPSRCRCRAHSKTTPELVLAVVTRQPGFRWAERGQAYRLIGQLLARGQSASVKGLIGKADAHFNTAMTNIEHGHAGSTRVITVFPSDASRLIGRTTFDREKLLERAEMGRQDMRQALSSTP